MIPPSSILSNGSSLQGWWKMNGGYTDASGNGNTLVGNNSPVFSSDVPFTDDSSADVPDSYAYAETDYANPHAPTSHGYGTGTTTYAYDTNGNLLSAWGSASTTFAWDYRNRMTGTATSTQTGTTTYLYDQADQRVRKASGMATTTYVSKFYDVVNSAATSSASTTAYIWVGDMLVAFVEGNGTATSTYFVHLDHLGSTNVVTNSSGAVYQAIDYYPFGEERINSNTSVADRTFITQFFDREQSLSYLNARYYQNSRGQFLSQDPVFLGDPKGQNLLNPQSLNSYSYAENNPIVKKDPTGKCPWCIPFLVGGAIGGLGQYASDIMANHAAGITGSAAFTSNLSSWQEYNAAIAGGAIAGSLGATRIIYGSIATGLGSLGQDWVAGRDADFGKAFAVGAGSALTGGLFKWGAGPSPAGVYTQATGRPFSSLPSAVLRNELRYVVVGEMFNGSLNSIIQSRYQAVRKSNVVSGASTGGGGSTPSGDSLWVTPSGAIVTFGGKLVEPPPAQSSGSKK